MFHDTSAFKLDFSVFPHSAKFDAKQIIRCLHFKRNFHSLRSNNTVRGKIVTVYINCTISLASGCLSMLNQKLQKKLCVFMESNLSKVVINSFQMNAFWTYSCDMFHFIYGFSFIFASSQCNFHWNWKAN